MREPRDLFHGKALCVVRPGSTQEVAAVLKLCHETGDAGCAAGRQYRARGRPNSRPRHGRAIVLSLTRMRALREIDPASNTMTVEAGMVLADVQEEAQPREPAVSAVACGRRGLAPSAAISRPTPAAPM